MINYLECWNLNGKFMSSLDLADDDVIEWSFVND